MTANVDSKPYGIVYCITNTVNGKKYIGQTTMSLRRRWSAHCGALGCKAMRGAIEKYGRDAFDVRQIDTANSADELDQKEVLYINTFRTTVQGVGYNIRPGGNSSKPSEESKRLMSLAKVGKKLTEAHKAKISESGRLREPGSPESFKKISESKKGVQFSEDHKKKLSEARMGWKMPDSHKEAIRAASTGSVFSEERRKKISDARKAYWAAKKAAQAQI